MQSPNTNIQHQQHDQSNHQELTIVSCMKSLMHPSNPLRSSPTGYVGLASSCQRPPSCRKEATLSRTSPPGTTPVTRQADQSLTSPLWGQSLVHYCSYPQSVGYSVERIDHIHVSHFNQFHFRHRIVDTSLNFLYSGKDLYEIL